MSQNVPLLNRVLGTAALASVMQLTNLVTSPHIAGVTRESIDRMAVQTAYNVLSVFDGKPIRENAVNPEVFD